jgi:hypothetical protein
VEGGQMINSGSGLSVGSVKNAEHASEVVLVPSLVISILAIGMKSCFKTADLIVTNNRRNICPRLCQKTSENILVPLYVGWFLTSPVAKLALVQAFCSKQMICKCKDDVKNERAAVLKVNMM